MRSKTRDRRIGVRVPEKVGVRQGGATGVCHGFTPTGRLAAETIAVGFSKLRFAWWAEGLARCGGTGQRCQGRPRRAGRHPPCTIPYDAIEAHPAIGLISTHGSFGSVTKYAIDRSRVSCRILCCIRLETFLLRRYRIARSTYREA